ncbi:MAG: HD domain-containing protein [Patescibacteria group bacterium]
MTLNEQKLIKVIRPYFKSARPGDWQHTRRVVALVKKLGKGRKDLQLLIFAAYLHDIGWSGLAPKGKIDFAKMIKIEHKVSKNSTKIIKLILQKFDFNSRQTDSVIRLVQATDKHRSKKFDEEIIVDADNLSKLCLKHLREKYQPKSFLKVLKNWQKELPKIIKTKAGKKMYPKLLDNIKLK